MKPLFLLRLALDFLAAGLLLLAMAYYWLGNAIHEVIGTGLFLLLIAHNIFNRRWYGSLARGRREVRSTITKALNLSLLVTMLTLLVTSVIISRTVFSFLPITSTYTPRQIHAFAAYWALIIVALHLGWHWSLIMSLVRNRLGMTTASKTRTFLLRLAALALAAYGVHNLFALDLPSKLFMQVTLQLWDFETSTPAFFLHHLAIVGLGASLAHYTLFWLQRRRRPK